MCHDRLVAHGGQTLHLGLFFLRPELLFYPLTSILRERWGKGLGELIGVLVRGIVEETNLVSVSATPLAEQEMYPQADSLHERKFSIQCLRLKAGGLLAAWG